jgi:EmrB/QacA subfamily drug resistance transporter
MRGRLRRKLAHRPPGYPYTLGRTVAISGGVMVVILLASLDSTIVTTSLPVIVGDIGGLSSYVWVFTAFLLCSTITVPIYGRLGDIYGRRRMLFVAIPLFLTGSLLCGLAQTMTQLIVFRGIQGLGAGGVVSLAIQTSSQIVPPRDRGKYVLVHSAGFAIGAILGPTLGGLIVDNTSWRWIFLINLPVGCFALLVIALTMPRGARQATGRVDYAGALLIAATTASLLLAVLGTGRPYTLFAFLILGPLFVLRTRRVPDPILPVDVVTEPIVATAAVTQGLTLACQFGATAFVPLFAQGVLGVSAVSSGIVVIPQTLGALSASILSGRWIAHSGHYRRIALLSPVALGTAMLLLATMGTSTTPGEVATFMVLAGAGAGALVAVMLAAQSAVPIRSIGSATAMVQFSGSIGMTVGATIFGAIVNHGLPDDLRHRGKIVHRLLPSDRSALAQALHPAFLLGAAVCVAIFAIVWFFLEERPLRRSLDEPALVKLAPTSPE